MRSEDAGGPRDVRSNPDYRSRYYRATRRAEKRLIASHHKEYLQLLDEERTIVGLPYVYARPKSVDVIIAGEDPDAYLDIAVIARAVAAGLEALVEEDGPGPDRGYRAVWHVTNQLADAAGLIDPDDRLEFLAECGWAVDAGRDGG